ncbi:MAG TPA: DUF1800 family protein, partial [Chloroflexia bacterium]|nr:DUF1800 family protein [Chloroflexia bacterium]
LLLRLLARAMASMDMPLYQPPNVAGWHGGRSWINPGTYFARANFAEQLLNAQAGGHPLVDAPGLIRDAGWRGAEAVLDGVLEWMLPGAATAPLRPSLLTYLGRGTPSPLKLYGLVRLVISSPSYQMN